MHRPVRTRRAAPLQRDPATEPARDAERALQAFGYRLSWRFEYCNGPEHRVRREGPERRRTIGFISETAIGSDGELIVFVEDPARPSRAARAVPAGLPAALARLRAAPLRLQSGA